jgi:hypothetical protein
MHVIYRLVGRQKKIFPRLIRLKAMLHGAIFLATCNEILLLRDIFVKNFRYVEKTSAECNEDSYLAILHLSRVELHCKLQEKLHRVTWPLEAARNRRSRDPSETEGKYFQLRADPNDK